MLKVSLEKKHYFRLYQELENYYFVNTDNTDLYF